MGRVTSEQSEQTVICSHFSHPHPLKLANLTIGSVRSCSAYKLEASGCVYSCTAGCNFHLHPKCYELPRKIKHEFDKNHDLILQPKPVYPEGMFNCDGCGHLGNGFSYNCTPCGVDLHSTCATLPMRLTHQSHEHELKLNLSSPGNTFSCDLCKKYGFKTWLYRCTECDFDVHLTCVAEIIPNFSVQPGQYRRPTRSQHGSFTYTSSMGRYGTPLMSSDINSTSGMTNGGGGLGQDFLQALMNIYGGGGTGGVGGVDFQSLLGGGGSVEGVVDPQSLLGGGGGAEGVVDPQSLAGGDGAKGVDLTSALGGDTGGGLNFLGEILGEFYF